MLDEDQPEESTGPGSRYREPDPEPAPEADLPDPERELPTVPSVDVPEPDPEEVPSALLRGFWVTVLVFNAALLVLAFGVLMLVFGVERPVGVGLTVLGLLLFRRGYRLYRSLDERHRQGELTASGANGDGADGTGGDDDADGGSRSERNG